jgi:hypothetical protein
VKDISTTTTKTEEKLNPIKDLSDDSNIPKIHTDAAIKEIKSNTAISILRETKIENPPAKPKVNLKPQIIDSKPNAFGKSTKQASDLFDDLPQVDVKPILSVSEREEKKSAATTLASGLFDDLPPPLNSTIDDGLFNEPSDLFSNLGRLNNDKSSDPLFDDNVDIFSDVPPDYRVESKEENPTDLLEGPNLDEDINRDNYADYPYFKKVNIIPKKSDSTFPIAGVEKKGLFSDSDDDLFEIKKSNKPQLFNDLDEDSLFSDIKDPGPSVKSNYVIEKNEIDEKSETMSDNKISEVSTDKEEPIFKPVVEEKKKSVLKPSDSNTVNLLINTSSIKSEVDGSRMSVSKKTSETVSPQKLPKLNINVKALLPTVGKTVGSINKAIKEESNVSTDVKSASFDEDPKSLDSMLCNDLLKHRAKIQVKRRPSSRMARHEAVRKSVADIYLDVDNDNNIDFTSSLPNSPEKKLEDVPKVDIVKASMIESNKSEIKTSVKEINSNKVVKNFFEDSDDDDIFSSSKKEKTKGILKTESKGAIKKKSAKNIFEDSDSDTDLFSQKKPNPTIKKAAANQKKEKSIFDDDDSDDLFFVSSKTTQSKGAVKKSIAPSNINSEDIFDTTKGMRIFIKILLKC